MKKFKSSFTSTQYHRRILFCGICLFSVRNGHESNSGPGVNKRVLNPLKQLVFQVCTWLDLLHLRCVGHHPLLLSPVVFPPQSVLTGGSAVVFVWLVVISLTDNFICFYLYICRKRRSSAVCGFTFRPLNSFFFPHTLSICLLGVLISYNLNVKPFKDET
jgi:hypothetical protein